MGDQDSINFIPPSSSTQVDLTTTISIPPPLKFLVSNIKNLVPHSLTTETYPIWRIQLLQQFTANGYAGHLTGTVQTPADVTSADYTRWQVIDNNLLSALFSTISQYILPYIITSTTTHEAWTVLERRLQPTTRSLVIQLKNELYHIHMKDQSLQQYLTRIKTIVDNISSSDSKIDPEDIILHVPNGLPLTFNSFKSTIHNSLLPIDLDTFYSLLCNEEIHLQQELVQDQAIGSTNIALYTAQSNQYRGRNNKHYYKNKHPQASTNILSQQLIASTGPTV
ncbi:hypothetical protein KFK09_020682 [Dendrobium nobile]|uniref:Retrovirus-related Pol polyprotein from transposon RE1 n=1 Tax=Dendrobium nobile TaxID=94219 RepID=A0A8T3ATP0_DENNO|nr:hypothetical protein KFK09_020682 [Dendrobium nobile]